MNKTAKGILIGAGVLVLLSGALVALKLTEPESGTSSGSGRCSSGTGSSRCGSTGSPGSPGSPAAGTDDNTGCDRNNGAVGLRAITQKEIA